MCDRKIKILNLEVTEYELNKIIKALEKYSNNNNCERENDISDEYAKNLADELSKIVAN